MHTEPTRGYSSETRSSETRSLVCGDRGRTASLGLAGGAEPGPPSPGQKPPAAGGSWEIYPNEKWIIIKGSLAL